MTLETGVKELAEAVGADVKALDAGKVNSNDPRLTDAREWTAATVSQTEAEAGISSTRRAWTAQRVRQAIVAWYLTVSTSFTRTLLGRSTAAQVRGDLELGTAATRNVGTDSGQVMEVGAFGLGGSTTYDVVDVDDFSEFPTGFTAKYYRLAAANRPTSYTGVLLTYASNARYGMQLAFDGESSILFRGKDSNTSFSDKWLELLHTGNILQTTGTSTEYPMSQKAVTDAINARGFADASGILTVTSGALSNDMSSFLSQTTKATMRSNLGAPQLNASATQQGGLKARLDGTTLYLTNNGTNP